MSNFLTSSFLYALLMLSSPAINAMRSMEAYQPVVVMHVKKNRRNRMLQRRYGSELKLEYFQVVQ
jgi:hypothetical protein